MQIDILHQPESAIAHIHLNPYDSLLAEAGAMVAMDPGIATTTTLRRGQGGGMMGGLKRMLAGESLFVSEFRAGSAPGGLYLAPQLPGDMVHYILQGSGLVVQSTGYVACTAGVAIDLGFQGLKSLFSGESIFWLTASGTGDVLLSSFGAIYAIDVDGEYIVDTGHIVAFEQTLDFSIQNAGGNWLGAFLGGEGFVCRFTGRGKLFCQTHNPGAFGSRVGSRLPARSTG